MEQTDDLQPAQQSEVNIVEATHATPRSSQRWWLVSFWLLISTLIFSGAALFVVIQYFNQPPIDFPVDQPVTIESGLSVREISSQLATAGVVRSEILLYYALVLLHDPTNIKASTYIFPEPLSTSDVATRLTEGDFEAELIRFTHIEGERVSQLAQRAAQVLPAFDAASFTASATPLEGTLFPDTYFIPQTFTDEDLLTLLNETYDEQLTPLQPQIEQHSLSEYELITLASIVEREANTPESMRLVAGILLNRLEADMPLQADASIEYTLDVPLNELPPGALATELRERESPYNTYKNTGLPPTPIGNPGLEAITAVLEPTESDYWFYLTAPDGTFYYATTYEEHQQNVARYLR